MVKRLEINNNKKESELVILTVSVSATCKIRTADLTIRIKMPTMMRKKTLIPTVTLILIFTLTPYSARCTIHRFAIKHFTGACMCLHWLSLKSSPARERVRIRVGVRFSTVMVRVSGIKNRIRVTGWQPARSRLRVGPGQILGHTGYIFCWDK